MRAWAALGAIALALAAAVPALAQDAEARANRRIEIAPYIEVDQAAIANLKGGGNDVLTYTTVAAGVDAAVRTRRVEAQANVRYEHNFGWGDSIGDQDILSGIARARVSIIPDQLSIEAGGLATRFRSDFNGANGTLAINSETISKVYSGYVGPTLTSQIGDVSVNAAYRFAYTRVEDDFDSSFPGTLPLHASDESRFHNVTASVGMQPGALPFGWAIGGGYQREGADLLDQRFDDKFARVDFTLPVSPTVALLAGAGYEDVEISQRDALRDANGAIVVSNGRIVTDPASPRLLAYDTDGLIWDVGVLWRPSRRTRLEARVGERYGSMHYIGSFSWQPDRYSSLNVAVYDSIDSFGRLVTGGIVGVPDNFVAPRNPFTGDLGGCTFGANGGEGGGQCLNDALSALGAANFRNRGVAVQYTRTRGVWTWGMGAGYARRKFIAPQTGALAAIDGATDENFYAVLFAARRLDDRSGVDFSAYANSYDSGLPGGVDVVNVGGYASYYRNLTRRLTATGALGVDAMDPSTAESVIAALAQIGVRYTF